MARHTSLYQAPRSPLIQGRTRWERPLWQAWIVGTLLAGVVGIAVLWYRTSSRGFSGIDLTALLWLLGGVVAGSAAGTVLSRFWAVRQRWLISALFGLLGGVATYLLYVNLIWAAGRAGG